MRCPYCNQEMKTGFVQSRVSWFTETRHSLFWWEGPRRGDIPINGNPIMGAGGPAVAAAYCKTCQKVIIQLQGDEL